MATATTIEGRIRTSVSLAEDTHAWLVRQEGGSYKALGRAIDTVVRDAQRRGQEAGLAARVETLLDRLDRAV